MESKIPSHLKKTFNKAVADYEDSEDYAKLVDQKTTGGFQKFFLGDNKDKKSKAKDFNNYEKARDNAKSISDQIKEIESRNTMGESAEQTELWNKKIALLNNSLQKTISYLREVEKKYGNSKDFLSVKQEVDEKHELQDIDKAIKQSVQDDKDAEKQNKSNVLLQV